MSKKDLFIAQKVMSDPYYNHKDKMFHKDSPVYIKSNEKISKYQKYLENREKVLSVISSSDQLLNMILDGTKYIDAYDISRFPKYFMNLKIAGIKSLNLDEYINFFYEGDKRSYTYDRLYFDVMRHNLNDSNKEFWDGLFNFYDWNDIHNSSLFSNETISISDVVNQNKYLCNDNYNQLKKIIPEVDINVYDGDILDMPKLYRKQYDLVYLSNIIKYLYENNHNLKDYKKMLEKFYLREDGIALTYLNGINGVIRDTFKGDNYEIDEFEDSHSGVLVYKKK